MMLFSATSFASQSKPCTEDSYRQFDFWLGQWQVFDQQGKQIGENHIFPILNGCALSENWTSATGHKGVSYNFYDKAQQQWHQTWIDASGQPLYLNGRFVDGKMVLKGERPGKNQQTQYHELSWSLQDDGSVRQHWRVSNDGGKSWSDLFVGLYKKQ